MEKIKILFLCTGNSCRSQMAEGWTRYLKKDIIEVYSAGTQPEGPDPHAVKVMAEANVDISGYQSKHLDTVKDISFDYVITLCGQEGELCPFFPGKGQQIHKGFDDPPKLAKAASSEAEALKHYRRVRDEIRQFIETLPDSLEADQQDNSILEIPT